MKHDTSKFSLLSYSPSTQSASCLCRKPSFFLWYGSFQSFFRPTYTQVDSYSAIHFLIHSPPISRPHFISFYSTLNNSLWELFFLKEKDQLFFVLLGPHALSKFTCVLVFFLQMKSKVRNGTCPQTLLQQLSRLSPLRMSQPRDLCLLSLWQSQPSPPPLKKRSLPWKWILGYTQFSSI